MIDRVQYQALVPGAWREIRFVEQGIGYGQAGLAVARAVPGVAFGRQVVSQADQALGGDRGRRAIHRLPGVEWVGGPVEVVAQPMQVRRAGVPHRNAIGAGVGEVEVGGGQRGGVEPAKGRGGSVEGLARLAPGSLAFRASALDPSASVSRNSNCSA